MRIGQLATLTGVSKRTIDYYTQIGLLSAERSESGYRLYSSEEVHRLRYIECLKDQRFTLEEIRGVLKEEACSMADLHEEMRALEREMHRLSEKSERREKEQLKLELSRRLVALAALLLHI